MTFDGLVAKDQSKVVNFIHQLRQVLLGEFPSTKRIRLHTILETLLNQLLKNWINSDKSWFIIIYTITELKGYP